MSTVNTFAPRIPSSATSFAYIRTMIAADAGIVLENGKEYLVEARLAPVARRQGFASIEAMVTALRLNQSQDLRRLVLDAMTTNETTFYRDIEPFVVLEKFILPPLIAARRSRRELRIWYAASSTGQEPYSVSMLINEKFPELMNWKLDQIATDISSQALDRARAGVFSQLEVNRGLPARLLPKYFVKTGQEWQLSEQIRKMVRFESLNLNGPWPIGVSGPFDIVFIRNVMIYFDGPAKKRILGSIYDRLAADGSLFLGGAETTFNIEERFTRSDYERAGCYRRTDAPPVPRL
jgi:chemotaxis protein methyltransferase CheR